MRLVRIPEPLVARTFAASLPPGAIHHAAPSHPSFAALANLRAIFPLDPDRVGRSDTVLVLEAPLSRLRTILDLLLSPNGCPWDREQTHASLRKNLLEECYEAIDAIDEGDEAGLLEELGDVLMQPMMHAAIAKRRGAFDLDGVAEAIADKLERRHPHVFGEATAEDSDAVLQTWDATKRAEGRTSLLSGVARSMPALGRAAEISKRAARAGFEWPDQEAVFTKLHEEIAEVREAITLGDPEKIEAEIGDLLFTAVNIARWSKVDPEMALRGMLDRFTTRFEAMEAEPGPPLPELTPEAWDARWNRAKSREG